MNRRKFFKYAAAGTAALAVGPLALHGRKSDVYQTLVMGEKSLVGRMRFHDADGNTAYEMLDGSIFVSAGSRGLTRAETLRLERQAKDRFAFWRAARA